jgi:hypothetical protein
MKSIELTSLEVKILENILQKAKTDYIINNLNDKKEIRVVNYENRIKSINNILKQLEL